MYSNGGIVVREKPDILLFLSDQHSGNLLGVVGDTVVQTPHIDALAADGCRFESAYTSCPLCVPARTSFLTGLLPSKTGIFTNQGAIPSDMTTFVTALAADGYETVLCGRMHFMGPDQRHGFTKRIGADICPAQWGFDGSVRQDLGVLKGTMNEQGCLNAVGYGNSNVLDYDREVVDIAISYLQEIHEKPQCIVVGTYGPHFPYVAPKKLYQEYREQVRLPESLTQGFDYEIPMLAHRQRDFDSELFLDARAAYYAMISHTDNLVGEVRETWNRYLQRNNQKKQSRKGLFMYLSDHGDQVGDRRLFAKQTFFDSACKIPLVIAGDGIIAGQTVKEPISIMDVGASLCDLAGVDYHVEIDGKSFAPLLQNPSKTETPALVQSNWLLDCPTNRPVFSELLEIDKSDSNPETCAIVPGRMVRQGPWKLIYYHGFDDDILLFHLDNDPHELHNLAKKEPEKTAELLHLVLKGWNPQEITKTCRSNLKHYQLLTQWGRAHYVEQVEMWQVKDPTQYATVKR